VGAPPRAVEITFEHMRLRHHPEAIELALRCFDPRITSYSVGPRAVVRRARVKGWLAEVPLLGARIAQPERWFWVVADGRRSGVVQLFHHGERLHLDLIVLRPELRGTGAVDRTMDFIEEQARAAGSACVDLYVDRRNYAAYHVYRRRGYRVMPERRFIFEVPRTAPPSARALAALPRHALAAVFGAVKAPARATGRGCFATLQQGLVVSLSFGGPAGDAEIDAAVRDVFLHTLACVARVALPFEAHVTAGRLVGILHRMEKSLE
jgi:ribosomal protein S18 acetylase RimI-like enzyme